jgi:hypothetical protein
MLQQTRYFTENTKKKLLSYIEKEERVEYQQLDEDKVYNETEFIRFLEAVEQIAPNTVSFRNELGTFDYGPRP